MSYRTAAEPEPDEPPADPQRPWLLQTWVSRRVCPDCGVLLFAARREGYRIDACGECGGAWLDPQAAARAIEERSAEPAALADMAAARTTPLAMRGTRTCPVCREDLEATEVKEAGVVVDVCREGHGAFYDPGELRRVIEAAVRRRPIPVDPEVEAAIAQAEREGFRRPPVRGRPDDRTVLDKVADFLVRLSFRD